jgi:acyl-CoA synthetase (AMP-forming)/AMP-acid ligase II
VLLRHNDVFDAAVVGTPHERWGQQVTALVQLREGATATEDDLREHTRGLISSYKAPKRFLLVTEVPRTPVGKIDYRPTPRSPRNCSPDQRPPGAGFRRGGRTVMTPASAVRSAHPLANEKATR